MKRFLLILTALVTMTGCALGPKAQTYTAPSNVGVQTSINNAQNNVNSAKTSTTNTSNAINDAQTDEQKLKQILAELKAQQKLSNK